VQIQTDARESPIVGDTALRVYATILRDFPQSPQATQAVYRTGVVLFERYFDLDGAMVAFERVRNDARAGGLAWDALLRSVDVLLARGDLAGARRLLDGTPAQGQKHLGDALTLKRGVVAYLSGSFSESMRIIEPMTRSLERDGANDAMEMYYHLLENQTDSASLAMFVQAELFIRRHSFDEARRHFERVSTSARTAGLASRSRIRVAEMLLRLGRPHESVALLDSVVRTMPRDPNRDVAHFMTGDIIEQTLKDRARALEVYEAFLVRHPSSLYAEEVRKRIRQLRGDAS
jgi:predicted negative regulator of RcsB-dependent stress response